ISGVISHVSGSSHLSGRRLDGAHDLVIAGAPAEIAGKTETDFLFGRILVLLKQGARRDQEARRTDTALQGRVLDELALQRVELVAVRHALDGLDLAAPGVGAEDEAGANELAVEHDAAGAAVAGAAPFLGAGEAQPVAQDVEQRLTRLADEVYGVAVDRG